MSLAMFVATYLLLSIEVGNKPLFDRLYSLTSPATRAAQEMVERLAGKGMSGSRKVGQQLFQNSVPVRSSARSHSSDLAAPKAKSLSAPQEHIPEAERQELDDLIKSYGNR